jgi:dynein heavy chain
LGHRANPRYDIFQIDVVKGYGMTEFKDDLKTCLMKCGNEQKSTTFLFADTQIVNEQMVEAINNVLNSGDVPNLYKNEDTHGHTNKFCVES